MPFTNKESKGPKPLWERKTENIMRYLPFSADGALLAVAGGAGNNEDRGEICLFSRTGELLWRRWAGDTVFDISFSADGEILAAGTFDEKVLLLDRQGRLTWRYVTGSPVRSVCLSSTGSLVAAGTENGLCLLDRAGQLVWRHKTAGTAYGVSFSRDESVIAAWSGETVLLLDRSGGVLWESSGHGKGVKDISLSADGSLIAASYVRPGPPAKRGYDLGSSICCLDRTGLILWKVDLDDSVWDLRISDDGSVVVGTTDPVASSPHGSVYLFDRSGRLLWTRKVGGVLHVSVSGDGSLIAPKCQDALYVFDRSGALLWNHKWGGGMRTTGVSLSKDGSLLAAATKAESGEYRISLFDLTNITTKESGVIPTGDGQSNDGCCHNCGRKVPITANFCTNCGSKLKT